MGEWISVKDRLPDKDGQYLVYGLGVTVAFLNMRDECWDDADGDDYWKDLDYFTHWMPLPEAPHE